MLKQVKSFMLGNALVLVGLFGFATSLVAVTGAIEAKDKAKYGVIDVQSVILNVEEGKRARASLEKEIKAKEKELIQQKNDLDQMNKQWKDQAALLSEAARMKKQQEFQEKFMALRNAEMSLQQEIKIKEQKATQQIYIKVAQLVQKFAEAKGFEAVFEANTSGVMYLKNPVDITNDVISAFEKAAPTTAKKTKKKK